MTKFVLEKLSKLDEASTWNTVDINLNFTATSSGVLVDVHVADQFLYWVWVRSCTYVKDYTILGPYLRTNALEKPLVTVDFSIVPLLNSENKVDSVAFKYLLRQSKVPGRDHKTMK